MIEPVQNLGHRMQLYPGGQHGAVDHQDWNAQVPGRRELGRGAVAARVLADHQIDAMFAHQSGIALDRERPAGHDHSPVRQGQSIDRGVDEAQNVVMLRLGRKFSQMHPAKGEEDATLFPRKRLNGLRNTGSHLPAVTWDGLPRRAGQGHQRHSRLAGRRDRVSAHLGGKRMCAINKMRDVVRMQVVRKTFRSTETAGPDWNRLGARAFDPSGIAQHRLVAPVGERMGQGRRLRGAAEDQDVAHG